MTIQTSCAGDSDIQPDEDTVVTVPGPVKFAPQSIGLSVKKMDNKDTGGISSQYLLYIPEGYNEHQEKLWPMIVYLHGQGERGTDIDLVKNMGLPKKAASDKNFPFIVIAPQCNKATWWDLPSVSRLYTEALKKYNIDQTRLYLTGNSMGGFACWEWAILRQDRFAAIVPISAPKPDNWADACKTSTKPIWAIHNADDSQVPVANARFMRDTLTLKCKSTTFKYTEHATGGHDAWTKAYDDAALYEWLLQQKK
ncbi:hypothetical protein MKQ68_25695 [Chitinophaga horti]|uniref:Phospholipase n=1 Tax=Chitinophaga horti TaxID=2920382 RepID=A0ABY6J1M4_9BACT|nr:hypothetical protein [Chitinophaga horti]UYQ93463.1 hypothetical protein MKQ68_25695 [Chitinophaga horti]